MVSLKGNVCGKELNFHGSSVGGGIIIKRFETFLQVSNKIHKLHYKHKLGANVLKL